MGANVFLKGVAGFGYKTAAKNTKIWYGIPRMANARIAVRYYSAKNGHQTVATHLWFLNVLARTTLGSASADGVYSAVLTATVATGNNLAASDFICVIDDAGYSNFARVVSWTAATKTVVFDTALDSAAAVGNQFYMFGVTTDTTPYSHAKSKPLAAAGTVNSDSLDGGILYAKAKGDPMVAILVNPSITSAIESLTVDYIDK